MSSKLNAESIGDWACTMANGIKGEAARESERERERASSPLCAPSCYWSHTVPIRQQMNTGLLGGRAPEHTAASQADTD